MPKSDFNKVALHLYWNHNSTWIFFCNFYIEKLIRLHCTCQKFCAVLGELLEPCFGWLGEKQKSHFLLSNAIITLETWKCLRTLIHLHNFKKVFFFFLYITRTWLGNLCQCNFRLKYRATKTVLRRYSIKMVLLKISKNPQENTFTQVSFSIKLKATLFKVSEYP